MIRFVNHVIQKNYQRKNLQHLKALERAPQGTLAFRSYLPTDYRVINHNQCFDGFAGITINHLINKRRIAEILSAAGREEEYQDRRKIMKASVSWNKYVGVVSKSVRIPLLSRL